MPAPGAQSCLSGPAVRPPWRRLGLALRAETGLPGPFLNKAGARLTRSSIYPVPGLPAPQRRMQGRRAGRVSWEQTPGATTWVSCGRRPGAGGSPRPLLCGHLSCPELRPPLERPGPVEGSPTAVAVVGLLDFHLRSLCASEPHSSSPPPRLCPHACPGVRASTTALAAAGRGRPPAHPRPLRPWAGPGDSMPGSGKGAALRSARELSSQPSPCSSIT